MGYIVSYEEVQTSVKTTIPLSMDYISDPIADVKIYVEGSLKTYPADYTISDIVQYPFWTTFTVNLANAIQIGETLRIEKNEEWNQWVRFKFPNLEARIAALEAKVSTATNIASRLGAIEAALPLINQSIVDIQGLLSAHDVRLSALEADVSTLISKVDTNIQDITALKAFLGVEGSVAIANNQVAPIVLDDFTTDGYEYSSVKVDYEIMRRTGTDYKSSVGSMYLVCKDNGVWFTERGLQVIDLDGVTFSITTDANKVGTLSYVSDLLIGAGYTGYFKYRLTKFEV